MNTNQAQDYEIPADWDVTVQGYYRQGYRAGIEAIMKAARAGQLNLHDTWVVPLRYLVNRGEKLLAEQEKK